MFEKTVKSKWIILGVICIGVLLTCHTISMSMISTLKEDLAKFSMQIKSNSIESKRLLKRYTQSFPTSSPEEIAYNVYQLENNLVFIQFLDESGNVGSIDNTLKSGLNAFQPNLTSDDFANEKTIEPYFIKSNTIIQTTIYNDLAVTNTLPLPDGLQGTSVSFEYCTPNTESCFLDGEGVYSIPIDDSLYINMQHYRIHVIIKALSSVKFYAIMVFALYGAFLFWSRRQSVKMTNDIRSRDFERSHDLQLNIKNNYGLTLDLKSWSKKEQPILCIIELDTAQSIQNSYGEQALSTLMFETRNRLVMLIGDDHVYRYSEHQFAILTTDKSITEILHSKLNEEIHVREQSFWPTHSIGVAYKTSSNSHLNHMKQAEIALYEAKKVKNTVHIFCEEINRNYYEQIELEHSLARAIQSDEIFLNYQVQIDDKGNLHGVEALARWNHSKIGIISPDKFIPIAESAGLMPSLGRLVYTKAFRDINQLSKKMGIEIPLSVNVSIREFMVDSFLDNILELTDALKFKRSNLTLEITESLDIDDWKKFEKIASKIRSFGFKLSLDDFGTGFSTMKLLAEIPLNEVKIDKEFVEQVTEMKKYSAIVSSIMNIAESMDLNVVCEGVETVEQLEKLSELGCKIFQGYLFSRPQPIHKLSEAIYASTAHEVVSINKPTVAAI